MASAAGVATAQDQDGDELARSLFLEGAQRYQAGDYQAAANAFEASYAERPVPVVLFNLAQALRFLDRPTEAVEAFQQYLQSEDTIPEERAAAIDVAIAELESQLAMVSLHVTPAGAHVSVDGRDLGQAPLPEAVRVDPGSHRFQARQGERMAERTIDLAPGDRPTLRLAIAPPEVVVEPPPPPPERPLRRKWWLWTLVGVVVVGGVTAGILLAPGAEPPVNGTLPTVDALRFGP